MQVQPHPAQPHQQGQATAVSLFNQAVGPCPWILLLVLLGGQLLQAAGFKAARSVHWGWMGPDADLFYNEMVVQKSTAGSYFMACGWNTGYFGIQELSGGKKIILFSVWDPTKGDDAASVPLDQRVEVLHQDPAVEIRRFGGEGTGGQCKMPFAWELGQTNRFVVQSRVEGSKTSYSGHVYLPQTGTWKHLVTFRTRSGGTPLKGYYSFVEDFRRDGKSVEDTRQAWFGNVWLRTVKGDWHRVKDARFTASGAEWESKDNISSGIANGGLYLATGGTISTNIPLRAVIQVPNAGQTHPALPMEPLR